METKDKLLNRLEVYYKEFKDLLDFIENNNKEKMDSMKDVVQDIIASPDDSEKAVKFVFDTQLYPKIYAMELESLKEKLLVAYDIIRDYAEIPQEIKEELEVLSTKRNKPIIILKKGVIEEVDTDKIEFYKGTLKSPEVIQAVVKSFANVKEFTNQK